MQLLLDDGRGTDSKLSLLSPGPTSAHAHSHAKDGYGSTTDGSGGNSAAGAQQVAAPRQGPVAVVASSALCSAFLGIGPAEFLQEHSSGARKKVCGCICICTLHGHASFSAHASLTH